MNPAELRVLAAQLLELADELEGRTARPAPAPARTWTGVLASADFWRAHGERLGVPVGRAARRAAEARTAPHAPAERPRYRDPEDVTPPAAPPTPGQQPLFGAPPPRHQVAANRPPTPGGKR